MARKNKIEKALRGLESLDEAVREKAVAYLARSRDPNVLPALEKAARRDPSIKIRFLAKEGLQKMRLNLTEGTGLDLADLRGEGKPGPRPIDLDRLKKYLSHKDPARRNKAVKAAMAYMNPAALRVITPHVRRERNIKVKGNCVLALGLLGDKKQVPLLLHYLEHKQSHLRACAVLGLSNIHDISIYPRLVHSLTDRSQKVRKAAFKALLRLGKPKLIKLLHKMAQSRHGWMRMAAARACGKFVSSRMVKILACSLRDDDPMIRKAARASLRRLSRKGQKAADELLEEYKKAGGEMTMTEINLPADLQALASPLNDEDPARRLAAVQEMLREKDSSLLEMAKARLEQESDEKVLSSLIIAVGRLGGSDAIPDLERFLSSPRRRIKASAVEALSFIDDPAVVPLLVPMLDDDDNRVRCNAIVALKNESKVDVIGPLRELAESDNRNDKLSAVYAILELQRPEATGLLGILQNDPDPLVREKVQRALQILADSSLMEIRPKLKSESARFEIPNELTTQAPSDDCIQPSTAHGHPVKSIMQKARGSGRRSEGAEAAEASVTAAFDGPAPAATSDEREPDGAPDAAPGAGEAPAPSGDRDGGGTGGAGQGKADAAVQTSGKKDLPGLRTQIDQMFAQAAKEKPRSKKKETKPNMSPAAASEGISRSGLFDKIKSFFTPPGDSQQAEDDGTPKIGNIVVICASAVILFLVFYLFFGMEDEGYDDENYDDEDF